MPIEHPQRPGPGGASVAVAQSPYRAVRPWLIAGILTIAIAFGGGGAWAFVARLDQAVLASGLVKVGSSRKRIQHREGGTVAEILVKDGDQVRAGGILLRLDDSRALASARILNSSYDADRLLRARLLAERDGRDSLTYPLDLLERKGEQEIDELMNGQRRLFEARRKALLGNTRILQRQIQQLNEKVKGTKAQRRSQAKQLKLIVAELDDMRNLNKKGFIAKTKVAEFEREAERLRGAFGELDAQIAEIQTSVAGKELEILQQETEFRRAVITELREVQIRLLDISERRTAALYVLDNLEIRSPVDGVAVGLSAFAPGEVIGPGETILEIVPINDELLIEARIAPTEIDNLSVGRIADIRMIGFDTRSTPVLAGRVTYLSADAFVDERSGSMYYTAKIEVSPEQVKRLGGRTLLPGMPVEVVIKTGERSAFSYLSKPIANAFAKAWREE